jgi:VIT1/CCC1 family predicted Fe2+/Mn2+ transporter
MTKKSLEKHRADRIGWLRAAVLGANDGIVSTASLMVGVAAANATPSSIFIAGIAGLVGGALSMAAGEYVSVSSQSDIEKAELAMERDELASDPQFELEELSAIYVQRGLEPELARQVAAQLSAKNALEAHARDELGITPQLSARPLQAALASAVAFATGAALPVITAVVSPHARVISIIIGVSLICLAGLGAAAARAGGAPMLRGAVRVTFWSALAMSATALIGSLLDTQVM